VAATKTNSPSSKGKVKIKSKKIMAKFLLRYMNSPNTRKILRAFAEGKSPSEVIDLVSFTKQRLNYWVKKFLKDKLIYESIPGKPKIYELTAFGKKVLTVSERGVKEPLLMESYDMKYRLLQTNFKRNCSKCLEKDCSMPKIGETNNCMIAWKKLGDPRNWQKWGFHYCGISVERNDGIFPTVIIRTGELSGFNPYEMAVDAGALVTLVKAKLHDLGLTLDNVGELVHKPIFHLYTEEAEEFYNTEGIIYTNNGHIDNSPLLNPRDKGPREPHEERTEMQQVEYMAMPKRIHETLNMVSQMKADGTNTSGALNALQNRLNSLEFEVVSLKDDNKRLTDANIQLANTNIDFAKEVKVLSANVKTLTETLLGATQQKQHPQQPQETNVPSETHSQPLKHIYE